MDRFELVILCFLISTLLGLEDINNGTSNSPVGSKCPGKTNDKCCYNHYMVDGECKACAVGTYRPDDVDQTKCVQCKGNYYGKNCAEECTCTKLQSCDRVSGCVAEQNNSKLSDTNSLVVSVVVASIVCLSALAILIALLKKLNKCQCSYGKGMTECFLCQSQTESEHQQDDDTYCEINESELIKDFDVNSASCDIEISANEYNHLRENCNDVIVNPYHDNVYVTLEKECKTHTHTGLEYDQMKNIGKT